MYLLRFVAAATTGIIVVVISLFLIAIAFPNAHLPIPFSMSLLSWLTFLNRILDLGLFCGMLVNLSLFAIGLVELSFAWMRQDAEGRKNALKSVLLGIFLLGILIVVWSLIRLMQTTYSIPPMAKDPF